MHLRTLALACALGISAALGGFTERGGSVPAAQGAAAGATIESATRTADPFLAAAGPLVEGIAEQRSSGPVQLQRGGRPRLVSARPPTLSSSGIPSAPVSFQRWTERGPREHHLGTPPPPAAA